MYSAALLNQFLMVIWIARFPEWSNVAGEEADATMLGAGQLDGQDFIQFVARDHKTEGIFIKNTQTYTLVVVDS